MQLDDSGDVFRYNFHGFPHLQIIRDDLADFSFNSTRKKLLKDRLNLIFVLF